MRRDLNALADQRVTELPPQNSHNRSKCNPQLLSVIYKRNSSWSKHTGRVCI